MKVGLLTTSFPRFAGDVPGQFVLGFAQALRAEGAEVEVLAPEPAERAHPQPPRFDGVEVHWVPYLRPRALQRTFYGAGVLDNVRRAPLTALGLAPFVLALASAAHKRASTWDAVVSHWALPCALIAAQLGVPRHLAVLHSADVFLLEQLPQRAWLARAIGAGANELLFSSRDLRERFLALLPPVPRADVGSRSHVCAMGIDPLGRAAPRATRTASGPLRIASLGRLIALKGLEHAIDAVRQLPDTELWIAGDGPARAQLEARARGANVHFVGELRGADKRAFFERADVFVLPSIVLANGRTEGMPTTLLEAMEHGLPVVASDVGGVRDVVESHHNGLLVPASSTSALIAAFDALRDPAKRASLARGARETAAQYHWPVLGPHLYELTFGAELVAK